MFIKWTEKYILKTGFSVLNLLSGFQHCFLSRSAGWLGPAQAAFQVKIFLIKLVKLKISISGSLVGELV